MYARFGYPQLEQRTEVDWLLENVKHIDSLSAQLLLREAYESSYEIAEHHLENAHPWDLVLSRHKEDYERYGTLYRTVHLFRLREVAKRFGYNLTEYLNLPREFVALIDHICQLEDQEDQKTFNGLRDQFEQDFDTIKSAPTKR